MNDSQYPYGQQGVLETCSPPVCQNNGLGTFGMDPAASLRG